MLLKKLKLMLKLFMIYYMTLFIGFGMPQSGFGQISGQGEEVKKTLAVLDLKGLNISTEDAVIITNFFRSELFASGKFRLLDRALVVDILNKFNYSGAGICDVECAINIGENLDCDKVITGNVSKLGGLYVINVRMVGIDTQSLELDVTLKKECRIEDLPDEMPALVAEFIQKYEEFIAAKDVKQKTEIAAVEPERKEPEPVEVVKNGKAIIKTIPEGAVVTANGKFLGVSPFDPQELAPGKYAFVAKKKGYTDARMEIEILSEKTTEVLLSLKPIQVVASPEAEKPPEEEKGSAIWYILGGVAVVGILAILLSGGQEEQPKPTTGTLAFSNNLNYTVYVEIDGSSRGSVNAYSTTSYTLSPGSHTVRVTAGSSSTGLTSSTIQNRKQSAEELENNNLSRINKNRIARNRNRSSNNAGIQKLSTYSKTYTIYITAGETTTLNHGSSWDNGDIYVQSSPSGAQVWLDNSATGKTTPATLDNITTGSHTITCKLTGYQDKSQTFIITSGQTTNVNLTLTPITNWVNIPSGCFNMGDPFNEGYSDERPVHRVCVSSFQMNKYEVTNYQYKQCVEAGRCSAPEYSYSYTRNSYYGNPVYNDYPVIYVDYSQAKNYCNWQSGRLPTEAEWEYAARGGFGGMRYPWGDADASCSRANYWGCVGDTSKVGSYAANGYGLYDMAGNVWEWINDWYNASYYSVSPTNNPQGPSSGTDRVLRGGSWGDYSSRLRVADRGYGDPSLRYYFIGFRCAR